MPHEHRKEDIQLVEGCLNGDPRCQQKLYKQYYGQLLAVCLRYCRNREEARDILQDGFVKIFQSLPKFNHESSLRYWMKRIMANTAIDHYRKAVKVPFIIEATEAYDLSSGIADVVSDLTHREMLELLHELPDGYRIVFNMYAVEGFSHKEIAEELGITVGTTKSQLYKARIALQQLVKNRMSIR